jgi:hypothetical protein
MADSLVLNNKVIMKAMVGREDLQFNMGILHFPKVLFLAEVKASVCKQKNLHTDLSGD